MNSTEIIHIQKLIHIFESKVKSSQDKDRNLTIRLNEVKNAIQDLIELEPNNSSLIDLFKEIASLVLEQEKK